MSIPLFSPLKLSWRLFWRDLRAGELTLLIAALILAIAATTTLRFFSGSLEQTLGQQAARLIGADLVVTSSRGIRPEWLQLAQQHNLQHTQTLEFSSVAQQGDNFQLSSVKAVTTAYPLRGKLRIRTANSPITSHTIPVTGTVWVEERLLNLLNTQLGKSLTIGDANFVIAGIIDEDSDRSGGFSAFSPSLLMNLADVPSTHIIQVGSRVNYRLLLSGTRSHLKTFQAQGTPLLHTEERLLDIKSANKQLSKPMKTATDYLSLAAIAAVLLSGIAVALAARRFSERHLDSIALMRSLGSSRRYLVQLYSGQLALIWLFAMLVGGLIGFICSLVLFKLLATLLPVTDLEFALSQPLLTGLATATLTLIGFALPAFIRLYQVSPLRVMRRELSPTPLSALSITGVALLALFVLLVLETGNLMLTSLVLIGGLVLTIILGGLCYGLLNRLRHSTFSAKTKPLNAAFVALSREPRATVAQMLALALGFTAILLVGTIRGELLAQWQHDLPAKTPNQFAVTIPADHVDALKSYLTQRDWQATDFYPVIRGRLVAINNTPTQANAKESEGDGQDRVLDRELNLTWTAQLPAKNELLEGSWFTGQQHEVSLESGLANRLSLKLGDSLTLQMAEGSVNAKVTSIRKVDWDSFQPNFYLIFPRHLLDSYPATYLTSFYVPPADKSQLSALIRTFPTVIFIDLAAMLNEVQKLLAQVSQGVQVILVFIVLAGVLVLLASIAASLDTRRQEAALLRALGASRWQLQQRVGLELLLLGILAGLLAVVMTEIIAAGLAIQLLESTPQLHPQLWLLTPLVSGALTLTIGLLSLRRVWSVSPMVVLREV